METKTSLLLDGKIYWVESDEEGKILSQEELDGEVCLKVLLAVFENGLDLAVPPEILEELEEESST